jgi:uncharacterized protein YecT (DUF1311 family)
MASKGEKMEEHAELNQEKEIVVLVHGIRTFAGWVPRVRKALEVEGFIVQPTNYEYFDAIRFLLPIPVLHRGPINKVWDSIRIIRQRYPGAKLNILAHSFGTFIVANILARDFAFTAHRVVFCGSIVVPDFPFINFENRVTWPILNEVGCRDIWPALANSVTWGYGSTGTYGFRNPMVRDRWHRGFSHSQFLEADFCKRFWAPFFRNGTIDEADTEVEVPPFWLRVLSVIKPKYLLLLVVAAVVIGLASWRAFDNGPSFDCHAPSNSTPTPQAICKNADLAAKDRALSLIFGRVKDGLSGPDVATLFQQERVWIDQRDSCGTDVACINSYYDGRISVLESRYQQMRSSPSH